MRRITFTRKHTEILTLIRSLHFKPKQFGFSEKMRNARTVARKHTHTCNRTRTHRQPPMTKRCPSLLWTHSIGNSIIQQMHRLNDCGQLILRTKFSLSLSLASYSAKRCIEDARQPDIETIECAVWVSMTAVINQIDWTNWIPCYAVPFYLRVIWRRKNGLWNAEQGNIIIEWNAAHWHRYRNDFSAECNILATNMFS